MSKPSIDIDRVVREVLAELGAARNDSAKRPATASAGVGVAGAPSDGELLVTSRVVAIGELLGRLDSVRRVVVSRGAVVTPAVRDELVRRGIALEYADSPNDRQFTVRLAIMTSGTDFDPGPLAAALDREEFRVDCSRSDCLIAAVDKLAQEICGPETLGVLLTSHAAAGLCLANRLPGIRAIGGGAKVVAAAAAAVGANLLVVDPRGGSFFQLKQTVAEFGRGGIRPCPEVFRERLT